jgi:membrane protein implicated in regulation of membrane protease activity
MVIALSVGSLIYHAVEWRMSWMIFATIVVSIVSLLLLFLCFRRRHRPDAVSSTEVRDESTRTK